MTTPATGMRTCPIAVSALAIVDDDALDHLARTDPLRVGLMDEIGRWTISSAHPPLGPAWRGLDHLKLVAWDRETLLVDIRFDRSSGGEGLRYAGCRLLVGGELPLTVAAGAAGRDMAQLLPHPVFVGHRWPLDQEIGGALVGPPADLALGSDPFARLADAARAERRNVAASMRALGLD
jgi:hypothetical protein